MPRLIPVALAGPRLSMYLKYNKKQLLIERECGLEEVIND
jgi:hypothetical protein